MRNSILKFPVMFIVLARWDVIFPNVREIILIKGIRLEPNRECAKYLLQGSVTLNIFVGLLHYHNISEATFCTSSYTPQ
jgi:hypothetical protein